MADGRSPSSAPLRPYFSASSDSRDRRLLAELRQWLVLLRRCCWLTEGRSRDDIPPGRNRDNQIASEIRQANLVFVLLSIDYLNASECMEVELPLALARQKAGLLRVVPICVRPIPVETIPISINDEHFELRCEDWYPQSRQPIDHAIDQQREASWTLLERELRTLIIELCSRSAPAWPTRDELFFYRQGSESAQAAFLDRFNAVIAKGLESGGNRSFLPQEQHDVASQLYWDLFLAKPSVYDLLKPDPTRQFAEDLFKLAYIAGEDLVRKTGHGS